MEQNKPAGTAAYTSTNKGLAAFESKQIWDAARGLVEHEDSPIDNRIRWMFTLVGFLFAGIAITVNAEVNLMSQQAQLDPERFSDMVTTLQIFRMSAALIGIIAALATIAGLVAAEMSILKAATTYQALAASTGPLPFDLIGEPASDLSPGLWFCITLLGIWVSFLAWTAGMPGVAAAPLGLISSFCVAVWIKREIKSLAKGLFAKRGDDV